MKENAPKYEHGESHELENLNGSENKTNTF